MFKLFDKVILSLRNYLDENYLHSKIFISVLVKISNNRNDLNVQ